VYEFSPIKKLLVYHSLFVNSQKLKILMVNHNKIHALPKDIEKTVIEEIHLQYNLLTDLPDMLLQRTTRYSLILLKYYKCSSYTEFFI